MVCALHRLHKLSKAGQQAKTPLVLLMRLCRGPHGKHLNLGDL